MGKISKELIAYSEVNIEQFLRKKELERLSESKLKNKVVEEPIKLILKNKNS